MNIKSVEVTEGLLQNILKDTTYKKLTMFDFEHYESIIRKNKRDDFKTEEEFQKYKREMIQQIQVGKYDKPKIKLHVDGAAECIEGKMQLFTLKLLGMDPVVEIIGQALVEHIFKIKNQRLIIYNIG